jgi:predicted alpha/beta-hydrolase family hydrolase
VLQGGRDTFGTADTLAGEVRQAGSRDGIRIVEVPGADHGMKVLKDSPLGAAGVRDLVSATVAAFVRSVV